MIYKILCIAFLSVITPSDTLHLEAKNHTVKEGESLSKISQDYSIPWSSVYDLNENKIGNNPNLIHPDTTILIPLGVKVQKSVATNYKKEAWAFLLLLLLFLYIFNKKKFASNYVSSQGSCGKTGRKATKSYAYDDYENTSSSHVDMDFKQNLVIKEAESSNVEVKEEKGEVKTQIDKLRKIKKK